MEDDKFDPKEQIGRITMNCIVWGVAGGTFVTHLQLKSSSSKCEKSKDFRLTSSNCAVASRNELWIEDKQREACLNQNSHLTEYSTPGRFHEKVITSPISLRRSKASLNADRTLDGWSTYLKTIILKASA